MPELSEEELKKLAKLLIDEVYAQKHDFWIDRETHYNEHRKVQPLTVEEVMALKKAAQAFNSVSGRLLQVSFFVLIIGSVIGTVLAALGKVKMDL